ncbi:MAG: Na+/H+ antiporter subunit C [Phycisphaerae bacterium]|nr:Na+/H+ antiporter subunit C [Phycisphaerae bacterium]
MSLILAIVVGSLYATGLYLMARRSIVKLIIGLSLLGHASNLLIFTAGGVSTDGPPLVKRGMETLNPPYADPLPQALILTAIVIGFGVLAFALVMIHRTHEAVGTDDLDLMKSTDV